MTWTSTFDLHGTLVWWRAAYRAQRYGVDVDEILTGGHEIEGLRRLVAEARGLAEDGTEAHGETLVAQCGNLEALLELLRSGAIDDDENLHLWSELPTFGGPDPADTTGVWSWDATRLLIGPGRDDLLIVPRPVQ